MPAHKEYRRLGGNGFEKLIIYTGNEAIPPASISLLIFTLTGTPECVGIFTGSCALQ